MRRFVLLLAAMVGCAEHTPPPAAPSCSTYIECLVHLDVLRRKGEECSPSDDDCRAARAEFRRLKAKIDAADADRRRAEARAEAERERKEAAARAEREQEARRQLADAKVSSRCRAERNQRMRAWEAWQREKALADAYEARKATTEAWVREHCTKREARADVRSTLDTSGHVRITGTVHVPAAVVCPASTPWAIQTMANLREDGRVFVGDWPVKYPAPPQVSVYAEPPADPECGSF